MISMWSRHSWRNVPTNRSAIAFARGRRPDRVRMMRMSAPVKTASNAAVNLLSRSRIRNRNWSVRSPSSINRWMPSRSQAARTNPVMLAALVGIKPNSV